MSGELHESCASHVSPAFLAKGKLDQLREIERGFHVRAFGEELARVNLDLNIEERYRYLEGMLELARSSERQRRPKPGDLSR